MSRSSASIRLPRRPSCRRLAPLLLALLLLSGCRQDMHDQPRYRPLAKSRFFEDARASRALVPGTVARGQLRDDQHLYTGRVGNADVTTFPFPVTREVLRRGEERYNIFCTPCHDRTGNGNGIVTQRGFRSPPSFHIDRLREAPVGHYFDAISNGFGSMYGYASRIPTRDRWAIIAYVRALQLSQNARIEDVPPAERGKLAGAAR